MNYGEGRQNNGLEATLIAGAANVEHDEPRAKRHLRGWLSYAFARFTITTFSRLVTY